MIRKIDNCDKEIYIEMADEFYHSSAVTHPVPRENFEKAFDHMVNDGTYFDGYIFEDNCETCGFCAVAVSYSQEAGGQVIWIEDFYIRPDFRGKGLGSELFDRIKEDFPDAARYRLEITESNVDAKRLYDRKGFEILPSRQMLKDMN